LKDESLGRTIALKASFASRSLQIKRGASIAYSRRDDRQQWHASQLATVSLRYRRVHADSMMFPSMA
jgi:hypothetical protein